MLLQLVLFLLNLISVLFVVYKSVNHLNLTEKLSLPKEQTSYLVSSWIVYLAFSSLKCSCAGTFGLLWNLLVSGGLVFSLLNTKTFNKKIFEENTLETAVAFGRGLVEKYLPKKKSE